MRVPGFMALLLSVFSPQPLSLLVWHALICVTHAVRNWPITAPLAGDVVPADKPYTITWTNNTAGPVSITLKYTDSTGLNITESTKNDGSFEWTPGEIYAQPNIDYFLSICDINLEPSECSVTYNGRFHISSSVSLLTSASASTPSRSSSTTLNPSTSGTTISTIPTSRVTSTSPLPSGPSPTAKNTSSLTAGPVVGISVGTGFGILLLAGLLFVIYRRFNSRVPVIQWNAMSKRVPLHGSNQRDHMAPHPSELSAGPGANAAELSAEQGIYELRGPHYH